MAIISNSANKVYLIGTAEFGPVNVPVQADSLSHVLSTFGTEGSLVDAYRASIDMIDSTSQIYLVKTSGTHSCAYLDIKTATGEIIKDGLYIQGKYANEDLDNIKISIAEDALFVIIESDVFRKRIIEYKYSDYHSMLDLVDKINEDTVAFENLIFCHLAVEGDVDSATALVDCNPLDVQLSGGNSGLAYTKNMMFNSLIETYSILESMEIDVVIPLDVYYDDTKSDRLEYANLYRPDEEYLTLKKDGEYCTFYHQLLEFCINQLRYGHVVYGVIGTKKNPEPFRNQGEYITYMTAFNAINRRSNHNSKFSHLISVCAGHLYFAYGSKMCNCSTLYGILLSSIDVIDNITNKSLLGNFTLYDKWNEDELMHLDQLGYVAFRFSYLKNNIVVNNAITKSDDISLRYTCNSRMIQTCMSNLKHSLEKYIGTSIAYLNKTNTLETEIVKTLEELTSNGFIVGYVLGKPSISREGNLNINISLQTAYMTEKINQFLTIGYRR